MLAFLLALLPLLPAPAPQDAPAPATLVERLARVQELLEAEDNGRQLGAALLAVANLRSAEAVAALTALIPELDGVGRVAAIQALGMTDHADAVAELRRIATESKQMPDRTLAVQVLAGEKDVEWLLGFFDKEKNGLVRGAVLRELLRARVDGLEELVLDAAKDKNGDVRSAGLEGIAQLEVAKGGKLAIKALKDSSLAVRVAACRAAALTGGPPAYKAMVSELRKTKSPEFRDALTAALMLATDPDEIDSVLSALGREKDEEIVVRLMAALGAAAEHSPEASTKVLLKMLDHPNPSVREHAIRGLVGARPAGALVLLAGLLEHDDPVTRADAAWALGRIGELPPEAEARLLPMLRGDAVSLRVNAARALAGASSDLAHAALLDALNDTFWSVRAAAVAALVKQRRAASLGPLVDLMEKEDSRVREEIAAGLAELTGRDFGENPPSWRHWLEDQPTDFALPTREEALRELAAAEAARRAQPADTVTDYHGIPIPRGGVVFVLDVSGSMNELWDTTTTEGTTRYQHFSGQLQKALSKLPGGTRFDIVVFASGAHLWRPELVPGSKDNIEEAKRFLQQNSAFGGTNIYEALGVALSVHDVQTVYLLTDGDPTVGVTNPSTIIQRIARRNRDLGVVIHTLAAGEVSAEFLADLAAANGGRTVDLR